MRSWFCKHDWELVEKDYMMSAAEMAQQTMSSMSAKSLPYDFFEGKLVQVFSCSKCGKLKRFVTEGGKPCA